MRSRDPCPCMALKYASRTAVVTSASSWLSAPLARASVRRKRACFPAIEHRSQLFRLQVVQMRQTVRAPVVVLQNLHIAEIETLSMDRWLFRRDRPIPLALDNRVRTAVAAIERLQNR